MPIDLPAVAVPAPTTKRLWVRHEHAAFNRDRSCVPKEPETATIAPTPRPEPQRLPSSRGTPLEVSNHASSWRTFFSTPKHPLAQQEELQKDLQKQLDRRQRTQVKLDAARIHLRDVRDEHAFTSMTDRIYCGGGLFNDHGHCTAESLARQNVMHYVKKLEGLKQEHADLLSRSAARLD